MVLVPWRWHDNADEPELLEALGAPGDPSVSRVRVVSAVSQEQGSLGWLVSTEPDDGLWWIPETDAGPGKPQPLERGPILGFGSAIGSRAVGWLLPEGFSEPVLTWWDIP